MRRCAGFTLLELLTALVLTSVVTLLVNGAVRAGVDSQSRLGEHRRAEQSARAMRAVLQEILRGARPALRPNDTAFVLEARQDAGGRPMDRIRLVSAVMAPPFSDEADWTVEVRPTRGGLAVFAAPVGAPDRVRLMAIEPTITGLEVRVVAQVRDTVSGEVRASPWARAWAGGTSVPKAVELTFWSQARHADVPLRTALPLGGGQ